MIAVADSGAGMDRATRERAFDPFFTTKEVGKGTGLGLSQVYGFARQSSGHVKIYSEVGEGTTVKIYLPRRLGDPGEVAAAEAPEIARAIGAETILVVEDDDALRDYARQILAELGYRVLQAASGSAALAALESDGVVDLLLTDVVMPGGDPSQTRAEGAVHDRLHSQRHRPPRASRRWSPSDRQAVFLRRARRQGPGTAGRRGLRFASFTAPVVGGVRHAHFDSRPASRGVETGKRATHEVGRERRAQCLCSERRSRRLWSRAGDGLGGVEMPRLCGGGRAPAGCLRQSLGAGDFGLSSFVPHRRRARFRRSFEVCVRRLRHRFGLE
jgi:hypothetical protein